jgi:Ca2+-binding EF-hand superfamily protein
MKFSLVLGCVLSVLVLGGCATAPKKHVPTVEELWKKADRDADGKVSRAEYQDFMFEQLFAIYDPSGDGFITVEEYVADGGSAAEFKALNVSGTGKLTLEEAKKSPLLTKRMALPFDEADTNHSGYVTWDEFQAFRAKSDAYNR